MHHPTTHYNYEVSCLSSKKSLANFFKFGFLSFLVVIVSTLLATLFTYLLLRHPGMRIATEQAAMEVTRGGPTAEALRFDFEEECAKHGRAMTRLSEELDVVRSESAKAKIELSEFKSRMDTLNLLVDLRVEQRIKEELPRAFEDLRSNMSRILRVKVDKLSEDIDETLKDANDGILKGQKKAGKDKGVYHQQSFQDTFRDDLSPRSLYGDRRDLEVNLARRLKEKELVDLRTEIASLNSIHNRKSDDDDHDELFDLELSPRMDVISSNFVHFEDEMRRLNHSLTKLNARIRALESGKPFASAVSVRDRDSPIDRISVVSEVPRSPRVPYNTLIIGDKVFHVNNHTRVS